MKIRNRWKASTIPESRTGTMNRCAQRRGPDRGSATRSLRGSWEVCPLRRRKRRAPMRYK